jgi:hypothetical protein
MSDLHNIKITDFGLAREKATTNSIMNSAVGTISYACPEIIMNEEYSDKADIWSLGCILYHMATLKPPFAGNNPLAVAQRIVKGVYTPIEVLAPEQNYSPLLVDTVTKLLAADSKERPSIKGVSSIIAPVILTALSKSTSDKRQLGYELTFERELRLRDEDEHRRQKQTWRQHISKLRARSATRLPKHSIYDRMSSSNNSSSSNNNSNKNDSSEGQHSRTPTPNSSSGDKKRAGSRTPQQSAQVSGLPLATTPILHRSLTSPLHSVKVGRDKLQPIGNPLEQLLEQLHKLLYVDQLPPATGKDTAKRRIVTRYKRYLFGQPSSREASALVTSKIKEDIRNLMNHSVDLIDLEFPTLEQEKKNHSASKKKRRSTGYGYRYPSNRMTYEQLALLVDELCEGHGYYGGNDEDEDRLQASANVDNIAPSPAKTPTKTPTKQQQQRSSSSTLHKLYPANRDKSPFRSISSSAAPSHRSPSPARFSPERSASLSTPGKSGKSLLPSLPVSKSKVLPAAELNTSSLRMQPSKPKSKPSPTPATLVYQQPTRASPIVFGLDPGSGPFLADPLALASLQGPKKLTLPPQLMMSQKQFPN